MDLIEMMAKLQAEKTLKKIEVATRAMQDTAERLLRRTEYWAGWNDDVTEAAERKMEAAAEYVHATTEDDRDQAQSDLEDAEATLGHLFEKGADRLAEDAKEDEDARRAAAGHGTLEGHLHR